MGERHHPTGPGHEATLAFSRRGVTTSQINEQKEIDALVGTSLRHFRVDRLLGRGGMGSVYLGHDTSLDRPVAIKVLSPEMGHDPDIVARFTREARTQARLRHPNVTQIYFIGEDRGLHFFAMEYIDGSTLDRMLERGEQMPWPQAIEYVLMAARGLRAAHIQGFIHRDVKPSNLLLEKDGALKIADFGLVKSVGGDGELTQKGVIVGSPLYMAPEQGRAEAVDHRSDIYSLGCTLYHLLTGKPPFDSSSPVAIMSMHVTDQATRIRATRPDIPETVERLTDRMMNKDPKERFASYDELISALESARPGQREYTGFFRRALAIGIDLGLLGSLSVLLGVYSLPLYPAYFILMHRLLGFTVGKRVFRLQVTDADGRRPSWKAVSLRFAAFAWGPITWAITAGVVYFIYRHKHISFQLAELTGRQLVEPLLYVVLSAVLLVAYLSGFLVAAFHPKRRSLHDLLTRTEVSYAPVSQK
jgi:uncharacterized RDD family membrane protein YckC/predicted Ser/Thr protein kinase